LRHFIVDGEVPIFGRENHNLTLFVRQFIYTPDLSILRTQY